MSAELLALDDSYSGVPMRLTKQQQHIEVNTKGATDSVQEAEVMCNPTCCVSATFVRQLCKHACMQA